MNMAFASIVLVLSFLHFAQGQRCYTCSDSLFGNTFGDNCYDNVTNTDASCPGSITTCQMTFTTNDGLVTSISRGCTSVSTHGLQCSTVLSSSGNTVETTTCDLVCDTNNCNSFVANNLRSCDPACGSPGSGYCNYFTGQCLCSVGYTGNNCEIAPTAPTPTQSCLQCDDATAPGCTSSISSTVCSSTSHNYCTASQTTLYDADGVAAQTVVTRGCTSTFSDNNDECSYSRPADSTLVGFFEYTCTRTCTENGCNTFTPQGDAPGPIYCLVCSGTSDSGSCARPSTFFSRTRCPSDQRHCYSRAIYRSSTANNEITHNEVQGYEFISIERGCTNTSLTSRCTPTSYPSSNAQLTTCEESCQTHGCNDGWPNRPKCIQCFSQDSSVADGSDSCLNNPQAASQCSMPYHQNCYYTDEGKSGQLTSQPSDNRGGYRRTMVRGCSVSSYGSTCSDFQILDTTFARCNKTCSTDGCNHGMGGSSRPATSLMVLFITSLLAYVTQSTSSQ